ncbi:hypothetical protein [Streptomyces sp. NPDC090445]|uniref:hypothetical protein n=1 Tax=Streptomyces sp. NPDC090445 TaxID=3365963 RepID=UPI003830DBE5
MDEPFRLKGEKNMRIRAAALVVLVASFAVGCSEKPEKTVSDSSTTASKRGSDPASLTAQEAVDEVKQVMAQVGIQLTQSKPNSAEETIVTLFATHDKKTSAETVTKAYKNLTGQGWKPSDNSKETFSHYEKGRCGVMTDTTFKLRPPSVQPSDDLINVTVVCPN